MVYYQIDLKKETTNLEEMKIKYGLVLHGTPRAAADEIEYNTIDAFQTSDSNTPGYYIVECTDNAYTLHEKYTCHAFDPTIIIP